MLSDRCPVLSCLSMTFVYCGQTVTWMNMKPDTHVGLGPDHVMLDGDPAPLLQRGIVPQFSAPVCCGQTAGWMKIPFGLCLHGFSGPFGRKWRFWGQNIGRGVATLTPNKLVLTFGSCYLYATFEEIDQEM